MFQAIRFQKSEFPEEIINKQNLKVINNEIRIHFANYKAILPIFWRGNNRLVHWGNKAISKLPRTGFCNIESLKAGKWNWLNPVPVPILASSAMVNGTWFQIKEGIQGILLESPTRSQHVYILTTPSTHYFKTMTGADRMPVLINQLI